MLSTRVIRSDLFRVRFFPFHQIAFNKSFFSLLSCAREYVHQPIIFDVACRTLCTKPSIDYSEILNKNLSTKFNLSKQVIVRGKAASAHQEEYINTFVSSREKATPDEWHELIQKVFSLEFGLINDINIDGKIMQTCVVAEKLDLARSYLSYVKSQKRKFNGAVVSAFIRVCYACRESMNDQDRTRMKQFTEFLQKRYAVADTSICEGTVKGLILIQKIDEALEVIAKNETLCHINDSTYSAVATHLIEINQFDKALSFIKEAFGKNASFLDEVYLKWIEKSESKEKLEKLLEMFNIRDMKPNKKLCDKLSIAFQSLTDEKYTSSYGEISNNGICSVCKEKLTPVELKKEEFEDLREYFLENVIVGSDIFKNTTPQELDSFLNLVKTRSPFDIVLDGLNVAYLLGTKSTPVTFVNVVEHVVAHFREQNKKVFLLGRVHMKRWPNFMDVMRKYECSNFFISDISEDDPFMLYATMYSGIHAHFVSRDLLRTEKFSLRSEKYEALFKQWQQARQIFITYISPNGRVYTKTPLYFQMNVQRRENGGWHIPYIDSDGGGEEYGIHRKWMCLENYRKMKN